MRHMDNWGDEIQGIGGDAEKYAREFHRKYGGQFDICPDGTYDVWKPDKALFNFRKDNVAYFIMPETKGITSFDQALEIAI